MFDWIDNLTLGIFRILSLVGIIICYMKLPANLVLFRHLMYIDAGSKGCSFKQAVFAVNKIPCRSALISENL